MNEKYLSGLGLDDVREQCDVNLPNQAQHSEGSIGQRFMAITN